MSRVHLTGEDDVDSVDSRQRAGAPTLLGRRAVLMGIAASMGSVFQTSLSPTELLSSAAAGRSSAPQVSGGSKWAFKPTYPLPRAYINVLHAGVKGDGITDDTAAINAVIAAHPGKVLVFPARRTYRIWADRRAGSSHGGGIRLNRAGTTLWLYGATIRMGVSAQQSYEMIDVSATDCRVLGGKLIGDMVAHAGTAGEWGHGIKIDGGAHRFAARDVYVTNCWGDGYYIWHRPQDVSLTNCTGDDNRRQGLSIIDAVRPRVIGGAYINNGRTRFTAPGGGIDLEPNPSTQQDVIAAVISGVRLAGNKGPGFASVSNGRTVTATVTGCQAIGNGAGSTSFTSSGFLVVGARNHVTFNSSVASGNTQDGWTIERGVSQTQLNGCTASHNRHLGVRNSGTGTNIK